MDGTDQTLALIARNHDLLRVAAKMRWRTRKARKAAERATKGAEHAKKVAERTMLIMVR